MNASKIVLPSAVATAIDHYVSLADTKSEAFTDILSMGYEGDIAKTILRHFDGNYDELMEALICGYEVEREQTPEEKLIKYFKECGSQPVCEVCYKSEYLAIKKTLDILGIKIAGVNSTEGDAE